MKSETSLSTLWKLGEPFALLEGSAAACAAGRPPIGKHLLQRLNFACTRAPAPSAFSIVLRIAPARTIELTSAMRRPAGGIRRRPGKGDAGKKTCRDATAQAAIVAPAIIYTAVSVLRVAFGSIEQNPSKVEVGIATQTCITQATRKMGRTQHFSQSFRDAATAAQWHHVRPGP